MQTPKTIIQTLGPTIHPCPCCTTQAEIRDTGIICPNCNLQMPFGHISTIGTLIRKWNTRNSSPTTREQS